LQNLANPKQARQSKLMKVGCARFTGQTWWYALPSFPGCAGAPGDMAAAVEFLVGPSSAATATTAAAAHATPSVATAACRRHCCLAIPAACYLSLAPARMIQCASASKAS